MLPVLRNITDAAFLNTYDQILSAERSGQDLFKFLRYDSLRIPADPCDDLILIIHDRNAVPVGLHVRDLKIDILSSVCVRCIFQTIGKPLQKSAVRIFTVKIRGYPVRLRRERCGSSCQKAFFLRAKSDGADIRE